MTIELPSQAAQTEFNLRRWDELMVDPHFSKEEWRVETDRYGHAVIMPPPGAQHGFFQSEVAFILRSSMRTGRASTECPISTADGVRAADVAWASAKSVADLGKRNCFSLAPEICVEVQSPDNSDAELREKLLLYIDAGAKEGWICDLEGRMRFFAKGTQGLRALQASQLCPSFPFVVTLP